VYASRRIVQVFGCARLAATFLGVVLGMALAARAQAQPVDPWAEDRQWLSLRAGYAKSGVSTAADGNVGAGFAYTRMGKGRWSVGAAAHVELLGRFASAAEIEVPITMELARHAGWKTSIRPYLGLGGGAFFHKTYRTGADEAETRPGFYFLGGANTTISDHSMIGLDVRMIFISSASSDNPVFPNDDEDAVHWSAKLNYSRVE
jgi:hypothetical protein